MQLTRMTLALAAAGAFGACSSTSTPPVPAAQHLYVGDDAANGSLRVYALPLTASSTPVAAVPMNQPFRMSASATTLGVATLNGQVNLFTLPITSASTPFATFDGGLDGTPVFLPSGVMYQGGSAQINIYSPPFTSASVPSGHIATASLNPEDMTIDPNGNVYELTEGNMIGVISGGALTITLAADNLAFRGAAATASQLFVCGFGASTNNVFIYALPLTASSTPAVTINVGSDAPEGCALDSSGNLYVGTPEGHIFVYAPPFSGSSTPTITLTTPADAFGIAVGP